MSQRARRGRNSELGLAAMKDRSTDLLRFLFQDTLPGDNDDPFD